MKNDELLCGREWGAAAFNAQAIQVGGQRLEPDMTKAYLEFRMGHAFHIRPDGTPGGITAYGTATSARTLANSHGSLLHQLVDLGHRVKAYDGSKDKDAIHRDYALGSIVAVDYPTTPADGWGLTLAADRVPHIHGAAVIHKQLEKVPQVLGEHLGGRHKWSVSLEMKFRRPESGFIVHQRSKGTKSQRAALDEFSPKTAPGCATGTAMQDLDLGYIVVESAPEDLVKCYHKEENRVLKPWGDLPVTFLQGGWDGDNHFMGMGVVRYPAEREAEIAQILAHDPDRLNELADDGVILIADYVREMMKSSEELWRKLGAG